MGYEEAPVSGVLTVCPFCACGCAIYLRNEEGRLTGVCPSLSHPISQGRLCTKGWHAHEITISARRVTRPLVRKNGKLTETSWEQALEAAAAGLSQVKKVNGAEALAVLGSASCTNEANFALARLARQALGTNNLDFVGRPEFSDVAGVIPSAGVAEIAEADVILLLDADTGDEHPVLSSHVIRARRRGAKIINLGIRRHNLTHRADVVLESFPGRQTEVLAGIAAEMVKTAPNASETGAFSDYSLEKAAIATQIATEKLQEAATLLAQAKKLVVLVGRASAADPRSGEKFAAMTALLKLWRAGTGQDANIGANLLVLGGRANTRGALEMGVHPALLSGYQNADGAKGLPLAQMAGKVRGLFALADDPRDGLGTPAQAEALLEGIEFLVVQTAIMSDLALRADVVLPAATLAEEEGCITNMEGCVQAIRPVAPPLGEARANWEIIAKLARQFGVELGCQNVTDILTQIAAAAPLYAGVTKAALENPAGTLVRPAVGIHAPAITPKLAAEAPVRNADYGLVLVVDVSEPSWEGDRLVMACPTLSREFCLQLKDFPNGCILLSQVDAQKLNLRNNAKVRVVGKQGEFATSLQVNPEVPEGLLLLPLRERGRLAALLSKAADAEFYAPLEVRIEGA
jgi:predicted molibdopterin-dependent oxidoreductase YjgC